jgi:CDP-diacylglycerol--glycerol-3-phosphate 3-phosphatidyltransferase
MWTLPNIITVVRICFTPVIALLPFIEGYWPKLLAFVIFVVAAASDVFDGRLARRRKQVTDIGILLDPIADKLLTSAAFISLVQIGAAPAWMVWIIIGREFAVDGLRMIASSQGLTIGASVWGKYKTGSQVVAIVLLIFGNRYLGKWDQAGTAAIWVVVALATLSGVDYFLKFSRRLGIVGSAVGPGSRGGRG